MDPQPLPAPPQPNDLLVRAARGERTERVPVWMMRQAGRYLPEYMELRGRYSFFERVETPELAAEITLQPLRRFGMDGAVIFSDILVIPQVLGVEVEMVPGRGPVLPNPLQAPADLKRLREVDPERDLGYALDALRLTREKLNGAASLIGFVGAPWTLMAYMIEGGGSKTFSKAKAWLYRHPEAAEELLTRLADALGAFLVAQIDAGAQVVQVFDSWAGLLSPDAFERFALPALTRIADHVARERPEVPKIAFARGAHYAVGWLAEAGYECVGLDWTQNPAAARKAAPGRCLQGNLDPSVLYAEPERIRDATHAMLDAFSGGPHIANLGHGMHPDHDPAHAGAFVEAVRSWRSEF